MNEPYHPGERALQEQFGGRATALARARAISDRIPAAASAFIAGQRGCVLAWAGPDGAPWAVFLVGPAGFAMATPDLRGLEILLSGATQVLEQVPPYSGLREGERIGVLFIDLATRRRLRVNGRILALRDRRAMRIAVEQAYPNCPRYIQRRRLVTTPADPQMPRIERGQGLTERIATWVAGADTLFVASAGPDGALDASHRGGAPGFVRLREGVLQIPDYPGNGMFNTLGNLALNPLAGLAFPDFERGFQLQLRGEVRLDLHHGEAGGETGGTGRWWAFRPSEWIVSPFNAPLAMGLAEPSPFNP